MRVFCPEHKRSFLAPRKSPVKCESHILGEFNFAGETPSSFDLKWQYCCNCEHFCPIDLDHLGFDRCPVCSRQVSLLYLCDRCATISFESDAPLQTKNFTLISEGGPQPSCPGCLRTNEAEVREHTCPKLNATFSTAINSCPICQERLDIPPSFPSLVADYLRKTRAANKLNVTFDFDSGMFVAVPDGEFTLVSNDGDVNQSIILPRLGRFSSKSDFYELFQDYYHCAKLYVGEVRILEPAVVTRNGQGWKFLTAGVLEVIEDPPKAKPPINSRAREIEAPVLERPRSREIEAPVLDKPRAAETTKPMLDTPPPVMAAKKEHSSDATCSHCGEQVPMSYPFCWSCGNPMSPGTTSAGKPSAPTRLPLIDMEDYFEEPPLPSDVGHSTASIFSRILPKEPRRNGSGTGSILKLIGIGVVALMLVPLGLFVLTRFASQIGTSKVTEQATVSLPADPSVPTTLQVKGQMAAEPAQVKPVARSEEDALEKLREKRISATASDRPDVLQAFDRTEKEYPNDYRFPYERAKLAIEGLETRSHEAAFSALTVAAEKAIRTNKTQEMLAGMEADKFGDFHKLSHGHREWIQVIAALKSKDANQLTANLQF